MSSLLYSRFIILSCPGILELISTIGNYLLLYATKEFNNFHLSREGKV